MLLVSPEPWGHIFVSKHHYAIHLGRRGNKVYFLNPPTGRQEILATDYENVWQVNYVGFPKGLRFYPQILQRYFIKKKFEQIQELCEIEFNVVWSFDNSVFYDFSSLPGNVLKVSHIVDFNQNFRTGKAALTADVCFGVSMPIVERLQKHNSRAFFVNHGCHINNSTETVPIPGGNKIKALYAGNLDIKYIDWALFKSLVEGNTEIDFILAGPWEDSELKKEVQANRNLYYLGKLESKQLFRYYFQVDILLLIYKANKFPDQLSNPHKMMEYLSSGKVIVATKTVEYKQLVEKSLLLMSEDNKEYSQLFNSAIQNLPFWNNEEKQKDRRAFAMSNTYDKQIDRIEKLITT